MKNLFQRSILLLSAAMVFAASCSKVKVISDTTTTGTETISFAQNITTLVTKATDTAFEANDAISVTAYDAAGDVYADNVAYTYNSSTYFTSTSAISYSTTDADPSLSFIAVYPTTTIANKGVSFTVNTDQSSGSNYTLSDLMSATTDLTTSTTPKLTFAHRLSKIVLNVTSVDVDMVNVVPTITGLSTVAYDLSTLSYTASNSQTIIMAENGTNSYKAILAPQSYESGATLGAITVDGIEYTVILGEATTLNAGTQYTKSVTIEAEKTTITITFDEVDSDITAWDEETIDDSTTDEGTTDESTTDTNGLVVMSGVYMDGNDGDLKSFLDLDSGTIYTASEVASDTDAANSVDFIFYFYTAGTTGTFGTPSGVTGSKLTNYSALSSITGTNTLNSTVGYCKALDVTANAAIIAAYEALDYSASSISALRSDVATFFGTTTYGTSAVYATDAEAATKNTSSLSYALSIVTYVYGVYYYPAADKYCIVKITAGETNSSGSVNAVTFDYVYGI